MDSMGRGCLKANQAVALLLLLLGVCSRAAGDEPPALPGGEGVALNQPVSIDSTEDTAPPKATTVLNSDAGETPDREAALRKVKRPWRNSGGAAEARSARGLDGGPRASLVQPKPWYRSGIGALALVLGLIGALVWALRRWVPATRGGESRMIRVVGRVPLSPKHSAALLSVGRRFVLVGMSAERVNTLCEISDAEEVAELSLRAGTATAPDAEGFERLLVEEAADYRHDLLEEVKEPGSKAAGAVWIRKPLSDLLHRLRALQSARGLGTHKG